MSKMLIAVLRNKMIVLFIIIFGTLSFLIIKHVVRAFERPRDGEIKSNQI